MSEFCCIGFGKCSYFYFYLLGAMLTNSINKEFHKIDSFILNKYILLQSITRYFSYILFGLFFYILFRYLYKKKNNKNNIMEVNKKQSSIEQKLIYNNILKFPKKDILSCIFICFVYVIHFESLKIIGYYKFHSLYIWTAHIGFVIIFMNIYFPKNIYKHQLYSMIFVIFLDTILIFVLTFLEYDDNKNIYQIKGTSLCIIIILYYIFLTFIYSYAEVKTKIFIDLKYLSPYIIIILVGIIGCISNIITALIFGFYGNKCKKLSEANIYCYANVSSYFIEIKELFNNNPKDFYLEIFFFSPFSMILEFLNLTFVIFIFKYLNPGYQLFSDNIYYIISDLIYFIFIKKKFDSLSIKKFIISEISEIFEFLAFLIYLELIELRFCGLNKNIRKNIEKRAEIEFMGVMNNKISINSVLIEEEDEMEKNEDRFSI